MVVIFSRLNSFSASFNRDCKLASFKCPVLVLRPPTLQAQIKPASRFGKIVPIFNQRIFCIPSNGGRFIRLRNIAAIEIFTLNLCNTLPRLVVLACLVNFSFKRDARSNTGITPRDAWKNSA